MNINTHVFQPFHGVWQQRIPTFSLSVYRQVKLNPDLSTIQANRSIETQRVVNVQDVFTTENHSIKCAINKSPIYWLPMIYWNGIFGHYFIESTCVHFVFTY